MLNKMLLEVETQVISLLIFSLMFNSIVRMEALVDGLSGLLFRDYRLFRGQGKHQYHDRHRILNI